MATKEHKRVAKDLIEGLESRIHRGPAIQDREIHSVREYLQQNDFSPASDYFSRLGQVQTRLISRVPSQQGQGKRNYGGEARGYWMQVQSAYDHIILSTCYGGEFNTQRGRVKISHRFNQAGRVDFVEAKLLKSLHPSLNGEFRKLVVIKNFQQIPKDWHRAEGFVLKVLPRELIFLYEDIFRVPRGEMFSWLINIGHRLMGDLADALREGTTNGNEQQSGIAHQVPLDEIQNDPVGMPIIQRATNLEAGAEMLSDTELEVSYSRKLSPVTLI